MLTSLHLYNGFNNVLCESSVSDSLYPFYFKKCLKSMNSWNMTTFISVQFRPKRWLQMIHSYHKYHFDIALHLSLNLCLLLLLVPRFIWLGKNIWRVMWIVNSTIFWHSAPKRKLEGDEVSFFCSHQGNTIYNSSWTIPMNQINFPKVLDFFCGFGIWTGNWRGKTVEKHTELVGMG